MGVEKEALEQLRIDRTAPREGGKAGWVVLVVMLLIGLGGLGFWWFGRDTGISVSTVIVRESRIGGPMTVLNASGYVTARRDATVSSKVTGKIVDVLVEEGMTVEEDQVLARLDVSNIEANLQLAEAQLQVALTTLRETEVRKAEAALDLKRVSTLVAEGILTRSELDSAQAEADSLQARLERQKDEITVAEKQHAVWRQELEDRIIRAPFAGVVISKDAQPGEMISPVSAGGGFTRTGICTLVDMSSLEIEVDVNESYINKVTPGQPVEATLDAYTAWKIPCKVIAIIPAADRQKATVKVRIGFDALDPRILPDMGVKVAFQEDAKGAKGPAPVVRAGLTVPKSALHPDNGGYVVWVVSDGMLERRAVKVGGESADRMDVTAGLQSGERVVVEGPDNLVEGMSVKETK